MAKKVIMDIDSVGDDILAVLYMALNPKADLLGVQLLQEQREIFSRQHG